MWDDYSWRDFYGRLDARICDTPYEVNMKPVVRYYKTDCTADKRVYTVNDKIIAIPQALNEESCYKKAEYINEWYPWLDDEEFNELVKFLHNEIIANEKPIAAWQEPPKELTSEERFENLKNKMKKKNEIKREPKRNIVPRVDLVTVTVILVNIGLLIILRAAY